MKLGIVCTNYNNSNFTRGAVESLLSAAHDYAIVVVDNNSDRKSVAELKNVAADFPAVTLLLGDTNIGYFPGLNKGIRYLRATRPDIDFMVVGNNDLVFPSDFGEAVQRNEALFRDHPVVSPDIITADGVHQNPHVIEAISKARELVYDFYYANYSLALAIGKLAKFSRWLTDRSDEARWQVGGPIYQGHGSCYILGPTFFRHFEELWAPSFLMGEEFFLSKQLSDRGFRVYYEPSIRVMHCCHASLGKIPARKVWEISRDAHRIYRKYVRVID